MNCKVWGASSLLLVTLAACSQTSQARQEPGRQPPPPRRNGVGMTVAGQRPPDTAPVEGKTVETRPPLAPDGQKPAFEGQTRAVAAITKTPLDIQVVAHGLNSPWAVAFLPNGHMLVTEKPGAMRIVTKEGKVGAPLTGVPTVAFGGDGGLLDLILDPAFASNRMVYFTYAEPRDGGSGIAVGKARLSADEKALENRTVILSVKPTVGIPAHFGSRLLFDKQGKLFVTLGERFFDPTRGQAQSLNSMMGKILRINTDGTPAPGNPFANTPGALPEIWSYGHRNSQGLGFNPKTGDLWDIEHGPQGGDEVNLVKPGKNYGWPTIAYGEEYDGRAINGGKSAQAGMEQPLYYWNPAIGPTGMTFYSGGLIKEWDGNLFAAGHNGEHIARLVLNGNKVVGEERLLLDQHQKMRDVRQGPDGALWVLTDNQDGRLIRIAPRTATSSASQSPAVVAPPTLQKLWETKPVLKFAEAVVFEPNHKFLYVSNVDGNPMAKDGQGSIGKIGLDGNVMDVDWVKGLDAPKGIGLYKNRLYVADLSDVVVIDVDKAAIIERIPIEGARLLHNIDIDPKGIVYVSDMFGGKVYRIEGSKPTVYLENLSGPAGLVLDGTDLYIYTGDGLIKADANKKLTTIAKGLDGRANGIVQVKKGEFILTSWGGIAYYVSADGTNRVLLDTQQSGIAAGINLYDPVKRIMYMTTDGHNTVIAYSLK
ncbi:MAG: PQQ-dependent sugar dehydrogenase [Armatimonas sp.]